MKSGRLVVSAFLLFAPAATAAQKDDAAPLGSAVVEELHQLYGTAIAAALSVAGTIADTQGRNQALHDIALVQAGAGNGAAARDVAFEIPDLSLRDFSLRDIAAVQVDADDVVMAFETIAAIHDPAAKAEALSGIAEKLGRRSGDGDTAGSSIGTAMAIADEITDPAGRAGVFAAIAKAQLKSRNPKAARSAAAEALQSARQVPDSAQSGVIMKRIAEVLAESGEIETAVDVAQSVDDPLARARAIRQVAQIQTDEEEIAGALATARRVEDVTERAWAMRDIARVQAEMGDLSGALETARIVLRAAETYEIRKVYVGSWQVEAAATGELKEELPRNTPGGEEGEGHWLRQVMHARILRDISEVQVKQGDIAGALETALGIGDAAGRARALGDIAELQVKEGDERGAKQTISSAMSIAHTVPDPAWRAWVLGDLAELQYMTGASQDGQRTFASAITIARSIEDATEQVRSLRDVADVQADARLFDAAFQTFADALEVAAGIEGPSQRARAYLDIARSLAEIR